MFSSLKGTSFSDIMGLSKLDVKEIPTACQYGNMCTADIHRVQNETCNWLKEYVDRIPIWSRLKISNCLDSPRALSLNKVKNYDIEIPGRLISLFGHEEQQTPEINRMKDLERFYLVACALALCSALSHNVFEWTSQLLDNIIAKTASLYPEICEKNKITPREFNMRHLNQMLQFQGIEYQITQQQVATGYLYMPYGLNEFNLARALNWFFHHYQFGMVHCTNHTLAFGFTLDSDYGFFMYDCQSRGYPLFKEDHANSYILRTNHLQVLLYCMIITFNVTAERTKFFMYNVDVRIINPLEKYNVKKEIYVPTIAGTDMRKVIESRVDSGKNNKKVIAKKESKIETKSATEKIKTEIKNTTENKSKPKASVVNIISRKTYRLNQQRSEKEVHNNAKTTIRAASKIFRAIAGKAPTVGDQKTKTNKTEPTKIISQTNKTDLPNEVSNNSITKISTCSKTSTNKNPQKTLTPAKSYASYRQKIIESPRKIPIDPHKKYYIIAVPKTSQTIITRIPPKKGAPSTPPSTPTKSKNSTQTVTVNIQRLTTIKPKPIEKTPTLKVLQKSTMEIDLEDTPSTRTLTNNENNEISEKDNGEVNPLGLKVYLVDNRRKCGLYK